MHLGSWPLSSRRITGARQALSTPSLGRRLRTRRQGLRLVAFPQHFTTPGRMQVLLPFGRFSRVLRCHWLLTVSSCFVTIRKLSVSGGAWGSRSDLDVLFLLGASLFYFGDHLGC